MPAPRPSAASRLFHTIAVVGAAMGCGSPEANSGGAAPDAGRDVTGGGAAAETGARPMGICDCARPGEFRCGACASGQAPVEGRCPDKDGIECTCDTSVEIAAPTDCPHPEQFACAVEPDAGAPTPMSAAFAETTWFAFADCTCDPSRPVLPSQCTGEQGSLRCAAWSSCAPADAGPAAEDGPTLGPLEPSYQWNCACESIPPPVTIAPI